MAQPAPRQQVLPEQEGSPWPAPGKWTYADYRRLPDDGRRYEVIRGYLYVSAASSTIHQRAPSTRRYDLGTKLGAYLDAGIPEVWFADPAAETIWAHSLSGDRKSYVELSRGGRGESVTSRVLPGLRIAVSEIFPR